MDYSQELNDKIVQEIDRIFAAGELMAPEDRKYHGKILSMKNGLMVRLLKIYLEILSNNEIEHVQGIPDGIFKDIEQCSNNLGVDFIIHDGNYKINPLYTIDDRVALLYIFSIEDGWKYAPLGELSVWTIFDYPEIAKIMLDQLNIV